MSKVNKLNRWQLKAVGSSVPPSIWNRNVGKLYPKACSESLEDDDPTISQSFDEFIEYGSRLPNLEGTGRFLVGSEGRDSIYLLHSKGIESIVNKSMVDLISTYFQLNVVSLSTELALARSNKNKRSITDLEQNVSFPLKSSKKGTIIDVFSIFDVMVEYLPPKAYTAVLLIDSPIAENGKEIYGRACGDRVVSSSGITSRREYATIFIHELLHTFGIDHCESFACIMNACSCESVLSTLELCPSELRKLSTAVPGFDLVHRWTRLEALCRAEGWVADADWYSQRLALS